MLACSALKRSYREILRGGPGGGGDGLPLRTIYLKLPRGELARRIAQRTGHPFPPSLLSSQLDTLEEPAGAEDALTVDGTRSPDAIIAEALAWLRA